MFEAWNPLTSSSWDPSRHQFALSIARASRSHARSSGRSVRQPTRHLFPHDDRNTDTVLRVWTESDTIEYQCDEEFEIVQMERAGWKLFGAPDNPFERERGETPYKATKERTSTIDADGNPNLFGSGRQASCRRRPTTSNTRRHSRSEAS